MCSTGGFPRAWPQNTRNSQGTNVGEAGGVLKIESLWDCKKVDVLKAWELFIETRGEVVGGVSEGNNNSGGQRSKLKGLLADASSLATAYDIQ